MTKEIEEIRKIIKEQLNRNILLEEPEVTKVDSPKAAKAVTRIREPTVSRDPKPLKPGFTLYHMILQTQFVDANRVQGEIGSIIQKMTQEILKEMGPENPEDVFQRDATDIRRLVQRTVLLALKQVADLADKEALEKNIYNR